MFPKKFLFGFKVFIIHCYGSLEMLNPDKLLIVKGADHFYIRIFKISHYMSIYISLIPWQIQYIYIKYAW